MRDLRKLLLLLTVVSIFFYYSNPTTKQFYFIIFYLIAYLILRIYPILSKIKRFSKAQIGTIDQMKGEEFEEYTKFLLEKVGYENVKVTKAIGDQGIDVIATKNKQKIGIQCKRYKSNVGNKAIQEAYAGIGYYSLDKAIVLTNSNFTKSAIDLANKLNVELWDRKKLIKLIETSKKLENRNSKIKALAEKEKN